MTTTTKLPNRAHDDPFTMRPGENYGLIAIPIADVRHDLPSAVQLADQLWVLRELPLNIPAHWQDWIGSIARDELSEADLLIVSNGPATGSQGQECSPDWHSDQVHRYYWALVLSGSLRIDDWPPFRLDGRVSETDTSVLSFQRLDYLYEMPGYRFPSIDIERLRLARRLSEGLETMRSEPDAYLRLWRVLRGFFGAAQEPHAGDRVHQFTRCIEGLIAAEQGKSRQRMQSRTQTFIGPGHQQLMAMLYDIRSAVEHLHGHFAKVTGEDDKEKALALILHAIQAEAIARYCLHRVVLTPELWPYFKDDDALQRFWELPEPDRAARWGKVLDLSAVTADFHPEWVPEDDF